jgi:hypothetical protein
MYISSGNAALEDNVELCRISRVWISSNEVAAMLKDLVKGDASSVHNENKEIHR